MEPFSTPLLQDAQLNADGTLKQTGKQNVKFYLKKDLLFRAMRDENGNLIMDPKTGLPKKEAYEAMREFVRVETKGDTNIKDDVADDFAKRHFYRQYKFFREGRIPDGNPIDDFDFLQPQTILELYMHGIHTIQQVAEMDDLVCEQLKDQSGFEIRDIAAQWVRTTSADSRSLKASKLELENAALKRELEDLRASGGAPRRRLVESLPEAIQETPINTIELTPEELAKKRPRKV